jgi:multiple sugar transport system permease protein
MELTMSSEPIVSSWQRYFRGRDAAKKRFIAATIGPLLLFMSFWTLFPLIWGFVLAFFDYSSRRAGGLFLGFGGDNPFIGLLNFQKMLDFSAAAPLEVQQFHLGVKITLIFALIVVPLNLMTTLPLAFMIESVHTKAKAIFRILFFLPVLAPSVGVAIMWGFVLHPQHGLLNAILRLFTGKMVGINWVGDPNLTFLGVPIALFAIIMAYLWQDMGYNLVIFIAALQGIPQAIKDAAKIDGASTWQSFIHITLPLMKPTILLAAILTMISAFQVFDIVKVMTNGGPNDQTKVLLLNIYEYAFRYQKMGWSAAVSIVLFLIVFSISLIQTRLMRSDWEY